MRTRRGFLGGGVAAFAGVAGCNSVSNTDGSGGENESVTQRRDEGRTNGTDSTDTSVSEGDGGDEHSWSDVDAAYVDWFGPEMANTERGVPKDVSGPESIQIITFRPGRLRSNDAIPDWWRNRASDRSIGTKAGASFEFEPGSVDRWFDDAQGTYTIATGSFDVGSLEDGLPHDATSRGTHRGLDLYTAPTKGGWEGFYHAYALGPERFVAADAAPDPDTGVSFVRRTLDTKAGDAERLTSTSETFARVVGELGDGAHVHVNLNEQTASGIRLRLSGSTIHRRSVRAYESEAAAVDDPLTNEAAVERTEDPDAPRSAFDQFSVYDDLERSRDGRFVVIDGTLPAGEVKDVDLRPP